MLISNFKFILILLFALQLSSKATATDKVNKCSKIFHAKKTKRSPMNVKPYKNKRLILKIASYIDHTLLKPDATEQEIKKLVIEALEHGFKAVCVSPCRVPFVKQFLKNINTKQKPLIATVIGFPTGSHSTEIKVTEAIEAYKAGADELDMVINIGYIKERKFSEAQSDIQQVVKATPLSVKVILETGLLTPEEIVIASKLVEAAKAHFVKTSTGFANRGATVEDIKLIKSAISPNMKIKASGGIKDFEGLVQMIESGAHRLGLSSSVEIMNQIKRDMNSIKKHQK